MHVPNVLTIAICVFKILLFAFPVKIITILSKMKYQNKITVDLAIKSAKHARVHQLHALLATEINTCLLKKTLFAENVLSHANNAFQKLLALPVFQDFIFKETAQKVFTENACIAKIIVPNAKVWTVVE